MNRTWVSLIIASLVSCSPRDVAKPPGSTVVQTDAAKKPVEMAVEAQEHIGLEVIQARIQPLIEYLQVTGTVQPMDSRVAHVRPIAAGRITGVSVNVGDRVAAGQTLATFDNLEAGDVVSQYQSSLAERGKLTAQLSVVEQQVERNRQLSDIGAISRKEYEVSIGEQRGIQASLESHEKILAGLRTKLQRFGFQENNLDPSMTSAIRAPFAGTVTKVEAGQGEVIGPETDLFQIVDLTNVWVQAEVYEKDLGQIQLGQTTSISVDTYPDEEFYGRVTYISDVLEPQTRTARVRCDVPNPAVKLKLDMFATVRLPTKFRKQAVAVPADAIQHIDETNVVFIRTSATTFEERAVEVGKTVQGATEIVRGLDGGESVVTRGAFHLKSIVLGTEIGEE